MVNAYYKSEVSDISMLTWYDDRDVNDYEVIEGMMDERCGSALNDQGVLKWMVNE